MKVTIDDLGNDIRLLALDGRLDAGGSLAVRDSLRALAERDNPRLIVDLSQVSFIDSTGLTALVSGLRAARQRGGDVVLAQSQQQAKMLFRLTMLDNVFALYDTLADAQTHWA